ncbi:MAG: DUF1553 domain-containing protein [Pirellulales bacterium]|nr:DUF1553 domain-containing protein [Pirellulales bacterium]
MPTTSVGMAPRAVFLFIAALTLAVASRATAQEARPPAGVFENGGEPTPAGKIDELVFARLAKLGIQPARVCSDAVFVRRVYLDVLGTLPTAEEARQFILDRNPDKRRALVDRLLGREEFADYGAMRWCDALRVKSEFPINLWPNAVQAYHRWIRACVQENVPYDRFVRELLTASGSNLRVPQVNFHRAMQGREPRALAQGAAMAFMGVRAESWDDDRWSGMEPFFARVGYKSTGEWKEEIVFFDAGKKIAPGAAGSNKAVFPDGTVAKLSENQDPREVFADWLISPDNPWFARCAVNRAWCWLVGRGIIHEPDDVRPDNPASNPELLAWLERELVASGHDLKHVYRLILNSRTYQLSPIPRSDRAEAEANFAHAAIRQLDAEVLIDALCQLTGTTETYWSAVPEPFTFMPADQRAVALADGSITSSFLEMFGRPARDTGMVSERNSRPTAAQRLHLLNSTHVRRKIAQGDLIRRAVGPGRNPREVIDGLYLAILSRYPTPEERRIVAEYAQTSGLPRREAAVDLAWALINSAEFLYRH